MEPSVFHLNLKKKNQKNSREPIVLRSRTSTADYPMFPRRHLNSTPNARNLSSKADLLISHTREKLYPQQVWQDRRWGGKHQPGFLFNMKSFQHQQRRGQTPSQAASFSVEKKAYYLFFDFQQGGKVATNLHAC